MMAAVKDGDCNAHALVFVSVPVTGDVLAERLGETSPALKI